MIKEAQWLIKKRKGCQTEKEQKRRERKRNKGMSTVKEREWERERKRDETSSPPSPMVTEWVEGRGCPSGPVNQQHTAEFCSATIALVTPNTQSFKIQCSCLFSSSCSCHHSLFSSAAQSCTALSCSHPHLTLQNTSMSPENVYFRSRWVMPLDLKIIWVVDQLRKLHLPQAGSLSSHTSYRQNGRQQVVVSVDMPGYVLTFSFALHTCCSTLFFRSVENMSLSWGESSGYSAFFRRENCIKSIKGVFLGIFCLWKKYMYLNKLALLPKTPVHHVMKGPWVWGTLNPLLRFESRGD